MSHRYTALKYSWFKVNYKHLHYFWVVTEAGGSDLMKEFVNTGFLVFIAATPIAEEVKKQYGVIVIVIGQTDEIRDQFYAILVERRISHPAVAAITEITREWLFRDSL